MVLIKEEELEPPAESGRGTGRNSTALALRRRGEDRGEEDALATGPGKAIAVM